MSTNVIFNLADTSGADIVNASANLSLRSRNLTIHAYDLWELLADPTATSLGVTGSNPRRTETIERIRQRCRSAGKVILSSHGPINATGYSVVKDPGNKLNGEAPTGPVHNVTGHSVRVDLDAMATLVRRFLDTNRTYYVAALICFAARTGRHTANHAITGDLRWADSYACQLFARLCRDRTAALTMSARTGQHGFSRLTGLSEVQTEAGVLAEIETAGMNFAALDQWLEETKLAAFGTRPVPRDRHTLDFALTYYTREATLMGPQRAGCLRDLLKQQGGTMPREDRAQFEALLGRLRLDANRQEVALHYGKIYYKFDPNRQRVKILRDSVNRIGWHSKSLLEEAPLATVLGT